MKLVCDTCGCEREVPQSAVFLTATEFLLTAQRVGWVVRTDWNKRGRMLRFCSNDCMKKHSIHKRY